MLRIPEVLDLLQMEQPYTLFLPTDAAYEKLDELSQFHFRNMTTCGMAILRSHIVEDVHCSVVFSTARKMKLRTLEGSIITITRDQYFRSLYVDEYIKIKKKDIMALNGVIHVIDGFILPDSGLQITQILEKYELYHLLGKVTKYALIEHWNNYTEKTFFLPTDTAFDEFSHDDKMDPVSYMAFLEYLISAGIHETAFIYDNEMIQTELTEVARLNLYYVGGEEGEFLKPTFYTWNCAPVILSDLVCCGGLAHFITRIELPPVDTLWNLVERNSELQMLRHLINGTHLQEVLNNKSLALTFFAPTDTAMEDISEHQFSMMIDNKDKTADLIEQYVLNGVFCCTGLMEHTHNPRVEYSTFGDYGSHTFYWTIEGVRLSDFPVAECDFVATNGVMHFVDQMLTHSYYDAVDGPYNLRL